MCVWPAVRITRQRFWAQVRSMLERTPRLLTCITRIKRVTQRVDARVRFDIYLGPAPGVTKVKCRRVLYMLRMATRLKGWYCRKHTGWARRRRQPPQGDEGAIEVSSQNSDESGGGMGITLNEEPEGPRVNIECKVSTLNVCTIASKRGEVEVLLRTAGIGILAIQETRRVETGWPVRIAGYAVFESPAVRDEQGKNGLAVCMSEDYQAFEVGAACPYTQAVQVGIGSMQWIVVNVYIPPSGNARKEGWRALEAQMTGVQNRVWSTQNMGVVLMGDWNSSAAAVDRWMDRKRLPYRVVECEGEASTFRRGRRLSAIDHVLTTTEWRRWVGGPRVDRRWDMSDHWPLGTKIHGVVTDGNEEPRDAGMRTRMDVKKVREKAEGISTHNFWTPLFEDLEDDAGAEASDSDSDGGQTGEAQETVFSRFVRITHEVAADQEVVRERTTKRKRTYRLSSAARTAIWRRQKAYAEWLRSEEAFGEGPLWDRFIRLKGEAKVAKRDSMDDSWAKYLAIGAKRLATNNSKGMWEWVNQISGRKRHKTTRLTGPVYDPADRSELRFGRQAEGTWLQYFSDLFRDDEQGRSKDAAYWERKLGGNVRTSLRRMDDDITWSELNMVLKDLKNWKAPGPDGICSEFYKTAVENATAEDFDPMRPRTALGRVLLGICNRLLRGGVPAEWNVSGLVVIHKSGDPKDMTNYRGIALINVIVKLVSCVVNGRIQRGLQRTNRLAPEQAGFRASEECVGQACALYEILRRRACQGECTYVAFVDFRKAYDTVPHEALLLKLRKIGITGRCLGFIRSLYSSGMIKLQTGGDYIGTEVPIEMGERQGCPISPVAFNVYINDLPAVLEGTGVEVSGLARLVSCLLFADDLAVLASTPQRLARSLKRRLTPWARLHGMSFGIAKCGVMAFGPDEGPGNHIDGMARLREFGERMTLGGQPVPIVERYVYLGLPFTPNLDLEAITKDREEKGLRAMGSLHPVVSCSRIPLTLRVQIVKSCLVPVLTYGCELWGMAADRCHGPQKVLSTALKTLLGTRRSSTMAHATLGLELGIAPIHAIAAAARARALAKYPTSRCLIGDLVRNAPVRIRKWTWVTGSKLWLRRQLPAALDVLHPVTRAKRVLKQLWKSMVTSAAGSTVSLRNYVERGFEKTRSFIKTGKFYHRTSRGLTWLARIRCGGFWSVHRLASIGLVPADPWLQRCPCCLEELQFGESLEHMFLHCARFQEDRDLFLSDMVASLETTGDTDTVTCLCGGAALSATGQTLRVPRWEKKRGRGEAYDRETDLGSDVSSDDDGGIVVQGDESVDNDDVSATDDSDRVDDSVEGDQGQARRQPVVVPPFVLVARYLQSVVPKRMSLVSRLLIAPRANAVVEGMVVLAGDVDGLAPEAAPVDGRLDPPG